MELVNTATGEVIEPMTQGDLSSLKQNEAVIEAGLKTFVEVGQALAEIRDSRLYRQTHGTFESYCQSRWGMDRTSAHRTIEAAEVVTRVLSIDNTAPVPKNVGQARPLVGLPADTAAEVMRTTHEATGGKVTASAIRESRTNIAAQLSEGYVKTYPALEHFRAKGEHERANALGRDLDAMDPEEREYRLGILDKTIAYEKRRDAGEVPLTVVPDPPITPRVVGIASVPACSSPDADDLVEHAEQIVRLMQVVDISEVAFADRQTIADAGQMLASFADRMKES